MNKGRSRKKPQHDKIKDGERSRSPSPGNTASGLDGEETTEGMALGSVNLETILKELREFRQDNTQRLSEIREDINRTNKRIDEVRIDGVETRIQNGEDVTMEMLKLLKQAEARMTDQKAVLNGKTSGFME